MKTEDVQMIVARATIIWDKFKAEEISGREFVAGIEALNAELPEGMSIRFA